MSASRKKICIAVTIIDIDLGRGDDGQEHHVCNHPPNVVTSSQYPKDVRKRIMWSMFPNER